MLNRCGIYRITIWCIQYSTLAGRGKISKCVSTIILKNFNGFQIFVKNVTTGKYMNGSSSFFLYKKVPVVMNHNIHFFQMLWPVFSWSIQIISRLIIHITAIYNSSKMYLILKNIGLYTSSFLEYDRKYKKRQNNALIT